MSGFKLIVKHIVFPADIGTQEKYMFLAGLIMSITLVFGGFAVAEILFYMLNGRFFWRAFVPAALRFTLFPNDKVELDCYDVLTEYASLMLYCSGLVLPFIALNFMGFVHIF